MGGGGAERPLQSSQALVNSTKQNRTYLQSYYKECKTIFLKYFLIQTFCHVKTANINLKDTINSTSRLFNYFLKLFSAKLKKFLMQYRVLTKVVKMIINAATQRQA